MNNETGQFGTRRLKKVPKALKKQKPKRREEVKQARFSRKVTDGLIKSISFNNVTLGILRLAIVGLIMMRIWFAFSTNNPYLLAPEAIVPDVLLEIPKVLLAII